MRNGIWFSFGVRPDIRTWVPNVRMSGLTPIVLLILLLGCARQERGITSFSGVAMTIPFCVQIGKDLSIQEEECAQTLIQDVFDHIDTTFNHWNPHSELSKINALPADRDFPLSEAMRDFLQEMDAIVQLTEGRFDPSIGAWITLWKKRLTEEKIPSPAELAQFHGEPSWRDIVVHDGVLRKNYGTIQLDFDGAVKGYAVDLLLERLKQQQWGGVYVEWGGEVAASGRHPSGRPWQIGIRKSDSDPSQQLPIAVVALENTALATSGDDYQSWQIEGEWYTHILDPTVKKPLRQKGKKMGSISILAKNCLLADALATAAMIAEDFGESEKWLKKLSLTTEIDYWLCTNDGVVSSSIERHFPP